MQERGFEPLNSLRDEILSLARLTTSLLLPYILVYRNLFKSNYFVKIEDGHSNVETPVLIPNTEAKHAASEISLRQEAKLGCCLLNFLEKF